MDFQRRLLEVGKGLSKDEVKALVFLCTDLLGRNPNSVVSANDLFNRLVKRDHLSPDRPHLLTELLLIIKRTRLARDLNLSDQAGDLISPYRKLLYSLYEEMTNDDVTHVKFLLNATLPRRKLEEDITLLEIFLVMEHMDLLSDSNLNELEKIIQCVCPVLKDKINQFKAWRARQSQVQGLNSPTTSLDLSHVGDACGALPNSGLSTETGNCASLEGHLNGDASGSLPSQENQASPEKPTSTNTNNEGLAIYPMTAAKRGICLILNNYKFSNGKHREGTMTDEKSLQDVFKWLDFDVEIRRDCTRAGMLSALQELGKRDHRQVDCVVCCVLSHGLEGGVLSVDGKIVKLRELMGSLNAISCPTLAGKPKLFFIQACQGSKTQPAVQVEADGGSDAVEARDFIPADADFLQAMSTIPSFVSFRERKNGTWFIQSLCHNLVLMVPRGNDLISILTQVNADVSHKTDVHRKKQMPQPAFSLRKRVVFPVPKAPPPSLTSV